MIDVHQNATLSESFEGDRSRVIDNRCNRYSFEFVFVMKSNLFSDWNEFNDWFKM